MAVRKTVSFIKSLGAVALILMFLISLGSCRDDFETSPNTGQLEFSRDTVFLDTVFTNIGSSTYSVKVYNKSDNAITIPNVSLSQGENSNYRLNVNGLPGKRFEDVEILAQDSIFIFIETTFDIQSATSGNEFLYTDAIVFDENVNEQRVELVTLVQDAVFLFPSRDAQGVKESINLGIDENGDPVLIEGFILEDDELTFTSEKPYVIYGYAAVAENKTMNLEAGARLHFHQNSGIIVGSGGSLKINGSLSTNKELLENEIILEGDRLEPEFSEVPGQWGTIWLTPGSIDNVINYATIRNATVGILVDSENEENNGNPHLTLTNSQIYNASNIGIYGVDTYIKAGNVVANKAGVATLAVQLGGRYEFTHSTITNFASGVRSVPAVFLSNFLDSGDTRFVADLDFTMENSIVAGNNLTEIGFEFAEEATANYLFRNTAIRFEDAFGRFEDDPLYDFMNESNFDNVLLTNDFSFADATNNDLRITDDSAVLGIGNVEGANLFPLDLLGENRSGAIDPGAYQRVVLQ
ncbi:MAG: hypothetical protein WBG71_11315 [Leeuwenhoekiella sp.]